MDPGGPRRLAGRPGRHAAPGPVRLRPRGAPVADHEPRGGSARAARDGRGRPGPCGRGGGSARRAGNPRVDPRHPGGARAGAPHRHRAAGSDAPVRECHAAPGRGGGGRSAHAGSPPRVRHAPTDAARPEGASNHARGEADAQRATARRLPPQRPDPPARRPPRSPCDRRAGRGRRHAPGRTGPRRRPRRRAGRRHPRDRADGRPDARGWRSRPRPAPGRARRPGAALGPADRPRRAHPPARGPRCGPAARPRTVPRGPGGGAGHARQEPRIRGAVDDPVGTRNSEQAHGGGRPLHPRRDRPRRALAGRRPGAARGLRRWQRGERRLDRSARHVRGRALPPDGRRGSGRRGRAAGPWTSDRGHAQGRPSREPDVDDGRADRGDAPPRGGGLGGRAQRLRASVAGGPRPAGECRGGRLPDRPAGCDRRRARGCRHRGADRAPDPPGRHRGTRGEPAPGRRPPARPAGRAPV